MVAGAVALFVAFAPPAAAGEGRRADEGRGRPAAPRTGGEPLTAEQASRQAEFVRRVLETPARDVDPFEVNRFLYMVKPEFLAPAERASYLRRREELLRPQAAPRPAQRKLAPLLDRGEDEAPPPPRKPDAKSLLASGHKEITREEYLWLLQETRCSESELVEHSTLQIVVEPGAKSRVRYFLHGTDPLYGPVAGHRRGRRRVQGTDFFGTGRKGAYCR